MLGLEFLAARSGLSQDGRGLGPAKASGATDRRPANENTSGPEGEDDHQGDGKAGYGTGLIGLKNLRPWSQLLEGRISGNGGCCYAP